MHIEINGTLRKATVLLSEEKIAERVRTLANEINAAYPSEDTLVVVVVLHGSLIFAADLVRHLTMPTEIESVRIQSYENTQSTGTVRLLSGLPETLADKNVLLVEDIVDTGRSIEFLKEHLKNKNCKSVSICTLLNKPSEHLVPISPEYIGFDIGKNFVIGYGLDLNGKFRNIPYIAEIL